MASGVIARLAAVAAVCGGAVGTAPPPQADLAVVQIDPAPLTPGGTTTVHAFVVNDGAARTAAPFTVLIELPVRFRATGPFFPDNCRRSAGGRLVSCVFPPGLGPLRSATALVPVRADPDVPPGTGAEGHVVVVSPEERDPAHARAPFTLTVGSG